MQNVAFRSVQIPFTDEDRDTLDRLISLDYPDTCDILALAVDRGTWAELEQMNLDYFRSGIKEAFESWCATKGADALRDELNACATKDALALIVGPTVAAEIPLDDELLPGSWLRIHKPDVFDAIHRDRVDEWREDGEDSWPWNFDATMPEDLRKTLEETHAEQTDYLRSEWLKGDRRDPGVLDTLKARLRASWARLDGDTLTVEWESEDEVRDWLDCDLEDVTPDASYLAKATHTIILQLACKTAIKKQEDATKRRAERERLAAYKAAQAEEARQKLLTREREASRKAKNATP